MTIDDFVKILDAISRILGIIIWPSLLLFILLSYREAFRNFFDSLSEFSVKGGGLEASAKKQIQAAANIAAVSASDPREKSTPQQAAKAAVEVVSEAFTKRTLKRVSKTKILWVDDQPDNNIAVKEVLQSLGILIRLATSTEQAMDILFSEEFDLVISDM
jgi:PleD family two-component response regulator